MSQILPAATPSTSLLLFFRDDFRTETWILIGASLQSLALLAFGRFALYLTGVLLSFRLFVGLLKDQRVIQSHTSNGTLWGRWTTRIPPSSMVTTNSGTGQVTVFILGVSSNSSRGIFTPGFAEAGGYFREMWRDCAEQRHKNGFLGKTSTLIASDYDHCNTRCWISYWKDITSLQDFANGPAHSKGMSWYLSTALKKYPDIGVMHETYQVHSGCWETIAHNQKPFGLSATRYSASRPEATSEMKELETLFRVEGDRSKTMRARMNGFKLVD